MPHRFPTCRVPATLALALALAAHAAPVQAQEVSGIVVEQGTELAVGGAVVIVEDAATGEVRAETVSDATGAFAVALQPGRYTAFAELDGLHSPTSPPIAVEPGSPTPPVELVLPSRLLMLASTCQEEPRPAGTAVVAGVVRDATSGTPLPAARVTMEWEGDRAESVTDGAGRYLFCAVPVGTALSAGARLFDIRGPATRLLLEAPAVVLHDLEVGVPAARTDAEVERVARPGPRLGPSTFSGQVVDAGTGAPVSNAIVRLGGTDESALTDREGRFRFERVSPRSHSVEVRHLAYGTHSRTIDIPGSSDVTLRLRLAARAIEVEGVTVHGRTPAARALRQASSSRRIVTGATLAEHESRGAPLIDVLRQDLGGLRVREGRFVTPDSGGEPANVICVESRRGVGSIRQGGGRFPFCNMITVYLDGVRIHDAGTFLRSISAVELESVEVLTGTEAGLRYGLDNRGGVLRLYSRGRGPYRGDPEREARSPR